MKRTGKAMWTGDLKDGKGTLSTETGTVKDAPYGFSARFESGKGTNPEELIAAAHAGCFTMALSGFLGKAGFTPKKLETTATVELEKEQEGWTISAVHLEVHGDVPGIVPERFEEIAGNAKENCPVSKLLNAKITFEAVLESS